MLKAACIQMVSSDDIVENFQCAMNLLDSPGIEACDLIVFPENFLNFGANPNTVSKSVLEEYIGTFKETAKRRSFNLVLGSLPFQTNETRHRYFSRSLLINAQGEEQAAYDKKHLFDVDVGDAHGSYRESDTYCPGKDIVVTPVTFSAQETVNLGMSICYDLRFPEQFISMRERSAHVIVVPSAFTEKTGRAL